MCAKIVPKLLTTDQKLRRTECCTDWKNSVQTSGFLERVIIGDESWFYEYDIELKSQSKKWKAKDEPRTKKCRKSRSKIKVILFVFFYIHGVVYHEFLPEGRTVNAAFYVEVLKRLRDRVRRVRPNLCDG